MTHCPQCGFDTTQTGVSRSNPQLRRYFALIKAAWHQWPEADAAQYADINDFRKRLEMVAGHRETGAVIEDVGEIGPRVIDIVEAVVKGTGSHAVVLPVGDRLVVYRPKSIAFRAIGHSEACALFDRVGLVIERKLGVTAEELLKEHESAA